MLRDLLDFSVELRSKIQQGGGNRPDKVASKEFSAPLAVSKNTGYQRQLRLNTSREDQ